MVCTYRKTTLTQSVTVFTAALLLANIHLYLCVVITQLIMDSQTTHTLNYTHTYSKPPLILIPIDTLGLALREIVCLYVHLRVCVCMCACVC